MSALHGLFSGFDALLPEFGIVKCAAAAAAAAAAPSTKLQQTLRCAALRCARCAALRSLRCAELH